jgi:hypothetical protein
MPKKKQPLQGEELAWYEVAFRLGKTVQELKELITPTEFAGWLEFLKMERDRHTRTHFYLAQIACQITKGWAKDPDKLNIGNFLLSLATPEEQEPKEEAPEVQEVTVLASKARWASALGIPNVNLN